ncbi:hypothetical protein MRS44_006874 [Fusarium solani]|uniref:uncharacterized protein n=1 Tax=Fusarium solani TaxID=169388 RepID=UPI0032C4A7A9|nr:hypothetical protein MRS44_006874 [Fusarium solani]
MLLPPPVPSLNSAPWLAPVVLTLSPTCLPPLPSLNLNINININATDILEMPARLPNLDKLLDSLEATEEELTFTWKGSPIKAKFIRPDPRPPSSLAATSSPAAASASPASPEAESPRLAPVARRLLRRLISSSPPSS